MGSSTSRIGSDRPSDPSKRNRTKRKLSSLLLCGLTSTSTSHSPVIELESPISSIENLPPTSINSLRSAGVSSSFFGSESEPVCTSSKTSEAEPEESESCNSSAKNSVIKHDSLNNNEDKASTSHQDQPIQDSVSRNDGSDPASDVVPMGSSDNISPINFGQTRQTQENLDPDENLGQNHSDTVRNADSDSRAALLVLSDSFLSLRMFGSGSRLFSSRVEPDVISGRILLVDTGSVFSSREARRNNGRLFGETLSRRGSRRESDFPSFFLTAGLGDDLGSRDRWLLDVSGHGRDYGSGYLRSYRRNEERRHFRSEMSERGLGGLDEREHQTRFCASGLHPDGTCSCGASFMGEEAGSLGSISRVVLLAQALTEVLDEIHRQPLSLSMSMLSLPAPEAVVDSFPLKDHKKMDASESGPNYVQQCYICLVDYEEGDKIRVLPCQHEYHAPCVDKWLKEVNGVCPVCRCNVCQTPAAAQGLASSELPA